MLPRLVFFPPLSFVFYLIRPLDFFRTFSPAPHPGHAGDSLSDSLHAPARPCVALWPPHPLACPDAAPIPGTAIQGNVTASLMAAPAVPLQSHAGNVPPARFYPAGQSRPQFRPSGLTGVHPFASLTRPGRSLRSRPGQRKQLHKRILFFVRVFTTIVRTCFSTFTETGVQIDSEAR